MHAESAFYECSIKQECTILLNTRSWDWESNESYHVYIVLRTLFTHFSGLPEWSPSLAECIALAAVGSVFIDPSQ